MVLRPPPQPWGLGLGGEASKPPKTIKFEFSGPGPLLKYPGVFLKDPGVPSKGPRGPEKRRFYFLSWGVGGGRPQNRQKPINLNSPGPENSNLLVFGGFEASPQPWGLGLGGRGGGGGRPQNRQQPLNLNSPGPESSNLMVFGGGRGRGLKTAKNH